MTKTVVCYSVAIAAAAFGLQWLEYQYTVRLFSSQIYVVIIAVSFAALGVWLGVRLASPGRGGEFAKNEAAIRSLGLSPREQKVLDLLTEGLSNAEIANRTHVSVNTVKSHLKSLYSKLDVSRRTQAVQKARMLRVVE